MATPNQVTVIPYPAGAVNIPQTQVVNPVVNGDLRKAYEKKISVSKKDFFV